MFENTFHADERAGFIDTTCKLDYMKDLKKRKNETIKDVYNVYALYISA